ncbi:hypothetical protein LSAT2_022447 [Lamellibrachia satsuma]|nr:hypothetical protein LSAT2_022447 [Lamellibrachia satsuma]
MTALWFQRLAVVCLLLLQIYSGFAADLMFSYCEYNVEIVTGSQTYAGTNAVVRIDIQGSDSNFTDSRLWASFESGTTSYDNVYGMCLGCIQKVTIRHDNTGSQPGWYVKTIAISQGYPMPTPAFVQTFFVNSWLSTGTALNRTISKSEIEYS